MPATGAPTSAVITEVPVSTATVVQQTAAGAIAVLTSRPVIIAAPAAEDQAAAGDVPASADGKSPAGGQGQVTPGPAPVQSVRVDGVSARSQVGSQDEADELTDDHDAAAAEGAVPVAAILLPPPPPPTAASTETSSSGHGPKAVTDVEGGHAATARAGDVASAQTVAGSSPDAEQEAGLVPGLPVAATAKDTETVGSRTASARREGTTDASRFPEAPAVQAPVLVQHPALGAVASVVQVQALAPVAPSVSSSPATSEVHGGTGSGHAVEVSALPVEIGLRTLSGMSRFEIRLTPENFGRVDVRLDIADDGRVRAHLEVDRPETLAILHRDARHLERALEQAGLNTADGGVSLSLRDGSTGDPGARDGGASRDSGSARDGDGRNEAARTTSGSTPGGRPADDEAASGPVWQRASWSRASGIDRRI